MKIALIQPNPDEKHMDQKLAYESRDRPPETGLAVLSSWINNYASNYHEVNVLNPNKRIEEITREASDYDILGISDWFSNHDNCIYLARDVKSKNPDIKIILGGPNSSMMPNLILENHPSIDYVISRDGEEALQLIAEKKPIESIPNLWYRDNKHKINFTHIGYTNLKKMPIWDFSTFQDLEDRLREYLKAQKSRRDLWLVPPLTLFSFRGCMKAIKEGVCGYCTSSEEKGRELPAEKLWEQILHLNKTYDAEIFYMCDDIFSISPKRMEQIANSKPDNARARIRAYGYLLDMADLPHLKLKSMTKNLQKIGVFNLFFGSENYDPNILSAVNKRWVSVEETARVIKTIYDEGGIKTTIAYMLGLPRESKESLETNLRSLEKLLDVDGCIERLYISVGMPLKGTDWYKNLESNFNVATEYKIKTSKDLASDDSPNYPLLLKLSIKHTTSTTAQTVNSYLNRMIDAAKEKIPYYRIGGFLLDLE